VSVLPLNIAESMILSHHLVFHQLPNSRKPIEAAMIWSRRLENQPAHAWLRDVISQVTKDLRFT
jgi:DNA-binding transcriptional LysR family regulator